MCIRDRSDVVDDIDQYYGGSPNQYKMAVANAEILSSILKEKYGNNVDFTFVGHSLGGGEAAAASMATGFDAITFNPAAVTSDDLLGNPSPVSYTHLDVYKRQVRSSNALKAAQHQ